MHCVSRNRGCFRHVRLQPDRRALKTLELRRLFGKILVLRTIFKGVSQCNVCHSLSLRPL
jgi:hypothetical protein